MSTAVSCGINPVHENPEWEITTVDVRNFIQYKFSQLTPGLRKIGQNTDDIKINLTMMKLGKSYVMAVIALPDSVLKGSNQANDIPSVFRGQNMDNRLTFEKPFYDLLKNWMYTKNERGLFRNASWRQSLQLSSKHVNTLMAYMNPRFMQSGGKKYVVVAIDMIKVFHSMLVDKNNPKQKFSTWVKKSEKTDDGMYKFTVQKVIETNKVSSDTLTRDLQRSLHRAINP